MFERFYKPDSNFVFVRITGTVDDNSFYEHFNSFVKELNGRSGIQQLVDLREADCNKITVNACVQVGTFEAKATHSHNAKIAILVSTSLQYGFSRAYSMFASGMGEGIEIFRDLNQAIEYLETVESPEEIMSYLHSLQNDSIEIPHLQSDKNK